MAAVRSLSRFAKGWLDGLLPLLFPPTCAWCQQGTNGARFCSECLAKLATDGARLRCPRCAATVGKIIGPDCDLCRNHSFAFNQVFRLGRYEDELAKACLAIKKPQNHVLASSLAHLLIDENLAGLRDAKPDIIVPIPLHWSRRWLRGYDQSLTLAEILASRLETPLGVALRRVRNTLPQAQLPPNQRRLNVRNAFAVRRNARLAGKRVLLVDDILTTGATCHQAARVLRKAGAQNVVVAILARGDNRPNANFLP